MSIKLPADRIRELEVALERATFLAERLFQMTRQEDWRAEGAEYMGVYEGDKWAEDTLIEIRALGALVNGSPKAANTAGDEVRKPIAEATARQSDDASLKSPAAPVDGIAGWIERTFGSRKT